MPTYVYNTVNDVWNPSRGKYLYAALSFSGSILGGNVNTIRPIVEAKYFMPAARKRAEKPHVIGLRLLASMVSGFGGRVAPPFSRFYAGGEDDIRGFDIRTVSPVVFYPTVGQVCNRDNAGNPIWAVTPGGQQQVGTCGSYTRFPYNTVIFPGGDTMGVLNFEYRIPIAGPVTLAYFVDVGTSMIWRDSQLQVQPAALSGIRKEFPFFPTPERLKPIAVTNTRPRGSTGLEVQVILPVVNAPFRVFWGYNWLRLNNDVQPPSTLPPEELFPNRFTYEDALPYFHGFRLLERKSRLGFTVARTF
jgi:outer membrane protein insertion porin family